MTSVSALRRTARPSQPRTKADKLAAAARAAAAVRVYDTDPDVIAYRIEQMRARVDRLIWTGLILGLLFTMANVQRFAAVGEESYSIGWWIAWLLDPMVSLVLVGVLLGEQIIARQQIAAGPWVRRTKWTTLALTYGMNTWSAWAALDWSLILLHSVPPAVVFCAAEAVTTLKHQITEAVHAAYRTAVDRALAIRAEAERAEPVRTVLPAGIGPQGPHSPDIGDRADDSPSAQQEPAGADPADDGQDRGERPTAPDAQAAYRAATVAQLREEMLAAAASGEKYQVTWRDVQARTGYQKRWCEGVLAEARRGLLTAPPAEESEHGEPYGPHVVSAGTGTAPHGGV
ncbi:hypothetical protein GCM10010156_64980 [Planobispora rosea]|uniref:DUF2637 domain-containing protein n=1 Tax=Planobispora rosea TaxID=35762 RepID=A0A8J3SDN2_PLARO|nr:hypothetical protein [Planobispora rosea]GGS97781.1 hypothetical protein GCM10010156_64980 [Planobispora rosea]GIH87823.1 hypothetical protein Pro02_62310 [Planobispora rosea]